MIAPCVFQSANLIRLVALCIQYVVVDCPEVEGVEPCKGRYFEQLVYLLRDECGFSQMHVLNV